MSTTSATRMPAVSVLTLFISCALLALAPGCPAAPPAAEADRVAPPPLDTAPARGATPIIFYDGGDVRVAFWTRLNRALHEQARREGLAIADHSAGIGTGEALAARQLDLFGAATERGVDGLIITPHSQEDLRIVDAAQAAAVPVIVVDNVIKHPWVRAHIRTDSREAAGDAARFMLERLRARGATGRVVVISGDEAAGNARERAAGARAVLEAGGYAVTVRFAAGWSAGDALKNCLDELRAPDEPAVVGLFAAFGPGSVAIVEAAEHLGVDAVTVGFDFNEVMRTMIREGRLDGTVAQDPETIGKRAALEMARALRGEESPRSVSIPGILVTPANVDTVWR